MRTPLIKSDLLDEKKAFFTHPNLAKRINENWIIYSESKDGSFAEIKNKSFLLRTVINYFYNNLEYEKIASTVISKKDHMCLAEFANIFSVLNGELNSIIQKTEQYLEELSREQKDERSKLDAHQSLLNSTQSVLKGQASVLQLYVLQHIKMEIEKNKTLKTAMLAVLNECFKKPTKTGSTLAIIGFIAGAIIVIATGGVASTVILVGGSAAGLGYSIGYTAHTLCLATSQEGREKLVKNFREDTLHEVIGLIAALLPIVSVSVNGLNAIGNIHGGLLGAADEAVGIMASGWRMQRILQISQVAIGLLASTYGAYNGISAISERRILEEKLLRNKFTLFEAAIVDLQEEDLSKKELLQEEKELSITIENSTQLSLLTTLTQ